MYILLLKHYYYICCCSEYQLLYFRKLGPFFFFMLCVSVTVFQMFTSVRVFRLSNANLTNQALNKIFTDLCENLLKVRNPYWSVGNYAIHGAMLGLCYTLSHWCLEWLSFECGLKSQFIVFVAEFLLQAALYDPLLSLSPQLRRGGARRRTHTGKFQVSGHLWFVKLHTEQNREWNLNYSYINYCTCVRLCLRLRWRRLPWRLTKTRLRRSQQTSPSPKVCLVKGDYLLFWENASMQFTIDLLYFWIWGTSCSSAQI